MPTVFQTIPLDLALSILLATMLWAAFVMICEGILEGIRDWQQRRKDGDK